MFLSAYKHNGTILNYKLAFRIIENLNTTNIKKIITYAKKAITEMINIRAATKNTRIRSLKTFLKRMAMSTYQNEVIYDLKA